MSRPLRSRSLPLSLVLCAAAAVAAPACGSDDSGGGQGGSTDGGGGGDAGGAGGGGGGGGLALGQVAAWPTNGWATKAPAELGMDAALLDAACKYALEFDGNADGNPDTNTQGVVIVRGGAIVKECYAAGKGPDDPATSWSAAKSFASTLIGIAIDDGLIPNVDAKMSSFFPEWAADARDKIRLEDVLLMQSGLKFVEEYVAASEIVELFNSADGNAYMRARPAAREPGSTWYYSSGDTQLLGALVEQVTGKAAGDFAKERIFDPLGMNATQWWKDGSGHTAAYCCVDAPTREFAKFGLLALREGQWDGKQIVSKAWIQKATQTMAAHNEGYAYQWWTQGSLKKDIPQYPDLYWADGLDSQKIFVIPSLDLVVAKNTTYRKPAGGAEAAAGQGVLSKIAPRGISQNGGTVGPLVWEDVALLAPIINSIEGATPVDFTPTQVGARPADPAACREALQTGYGTFCEAVHGCACDKCSVQMLDCNTNEGCAAIVNCALRTGCRGPGCVAPEACGDVITQFSGTGTGGIETQMALALSDCTVSSQCGVSCQ